jgi:hypothetical protein
MRPVPEPRKAKASVPSLRYGPALREPGTGQEFFSSPGRKIKGAVRVFYLIPSCLCNFEISLRTKGVFYE